MREFDCGSLKVKGFDSRAAMGEAAGAAAAQALAALLAKQKEVNVLFAAAPSQNEVLAHLAARRDLDWGKVNAFHMDEYTGLEPEHPAGFGNFLRRGIFDRLPFGGVHFLNGNAPDPQEEAGRYAALLQSHPLDLALMGVGENGHLAFNDPPVADFSDPLLVKVVELEEACRQQQVNDGCFPALAQVPTHALTLTIPALMAAKIVVCTVPGPTKAQAVKAMLSGRVSTACPASVLTTHPNAALFLDQDAAALLSGDVP